MKTKNTKPSVYVTDANTDKRIQYLLTKMAVAHLTPPVQGANSNVAVMHYGYRNPC